MISLSLELELQLFLNHLYLEFLKAKHFMSPARKKLRMQFVMMNSTTKKKVETCYSQVQVKNAEYQIGITVLCEGYFTEIAIYINGKVEATVIISC